MMKMKQILITMLMLLGAVNVNAQLWTVQRTDSAKQAEYREKIGIDMTVADFGTKKIDEKVMGKRLAGILNFLMENYKQGSYERQLALILGEQVEALDKLYFNIKKIKFLNAIKKGNEINIYYRVWPDKNTANVKQADLIFNFKNGVSENENTNVFFSNLSHYVKSREKLNNK